MKEHHLKIINSKGEKTDILIELSEKEYYECYITATSIVFDESISICKSDYFECLIELRLQLEAKDYLILCKGAIENIVLSGMCRDMGRGLSGYELHKYQNPKMENLVSIFEPIEEGAVTVAAQKRFHKKWLNKNFKAKSINFILKIISVFERK